MTKFFKGKNKKAAEVPTEAPVPRQMDEIKKSYEELRNRAGDLQYQAFILKRDLEQINQALVSVNHEAAARQKLDKEAADKQAEETKQVQ